MVAYGTVQGRYLTPESEGSTQVPLAGTVTFLASTPLLVAQDLVTVLPVETAVELDDEGFFTVDLVATDDPTTNPTDFTYLVSFRYMHDRDYAFVAYESFSIEVPANTVVDLTAVSPVPSQPGTPTDPGGAQGAINLAISAHRADETPHPTYDDASDFTLLFENKLY
jgi:hypothetical protein